MRNILGTIALIILAFVGGRLLYFGFSAYTPPDRPLPPASIDAAAVSPRLEAVDNPTVSKGVIAVDYAHDNALFIEELNVLFSKTVSRGFSYEIIFDPNTVDFETEGQGLTDKLRYAKALIVPLPRKDFTAPEVAEIKRFVQNGGRLLLIGDPTRTIGVDSLNSLAGAFDIIYLNDYLYSLEHNDNNYRNVIYSNFADSPLTHGLTAGSKLVFYSGGSVASPGHEIIMGDATTFSSISEGGRAPVAAVLAANNRTLALGDLTFFSEPYSNAEHNGTFINNIADFITGGQRDFELKDFPFFLADTVDIVFDNSLVFNSQYGDSVVLKEQLEKLDRRVTFADKIGDTNDVIYIGRFDETGSIQKYLAQANIAIFGPDDDGNNGKAKAADEKSAALVSDAPPGKEMRFVDGRIEIAGMGNLERGGATLFYLYREENRNILIFLSDTPDTNEDAFKVLFKNELSTCTASPTIAVCQTQEPGGKLPPTLRRSRIDNILIVSDDNGRKRDDAKTGALEFQTVLSNTYVVDIQETAKDKSPELDQLLEYDAVIWATGDYWDDSIDQDDTDMLLKYVELGGNLILSGASIAFDWDHTDFLNKVAHADYLDFGEQKDLELALPGHPIAKGFDEGAIITLLNPPSGEKLEPDVVQHTADARVIFQRGPESKQAGAAAVIAYEDERVKIAYYAFPIYLLPLEERATLVNNTVLWFTKKPLDLPDEDDYAPFEPADREEEPTDEEKPADENGEQQEDNQNDNTGGQ
jgi:hypothetical protein